MKIHKSIKKTLGLPIKTPDTEIISQWKKRISELCKPCWELKYCPYGPIVEDFPIFPPTRKYSIDHNNYLKECIRTGKFGTGEKLDSLRRKWFEKQIKEFDKEDYPEEISKEFLEASCRVFGHVCPVFLVAEPLTETKERRKHSRHIPRDVILKVVRRDGQICQKCNEPVIDDEVEFDHIIPFSKGGNTTTENLRLIHKNCNRRKSSSLKEVLHPNPIEHLFELKKKK
ncbi:MAG: HNH endonuclease signature motif containing protein [Candidatus Roizmanbacteria bacterium]|nr:HNH endonuclease signature motif containing protein [Candidatus Roizmanbacteria bacterium]